MAKTYRKRRYYKRKGRWSANIQEVGNNVTATAGTWSNFETILSNPVQNPSYVSQTFTVKNIEISFNIDYENPTGGMGNNIEGVTAYIMFVPQGMNVTADYNLQHPEFILSYKYLGSPSNEYTGSGSQLANQQYQPIRVKTRMARKLQSGDSVILFLKGVNQSTAEIIFRLSGLIRWWTKAN